MTCRQTWWHGERCDVVSDKIERLTELLTLQCTAVWLQNLEPKKRLAWIGEYLCAVLCSVHICRWELKKCKEWWIYRMIVRILQALPGGGGGGGGGGLHYSQHERWWCHQKRLAGWGCWQNNEQQEMGFIWKNDENICLFFCLILSVVVRPGRPGRWRHINNAPAWVLPTLVMGCVGSWWCEVVWGTVNTNYRHRHHHTPQPDVTCDLWDIQYFSSVEERNDKNNSHQSPRSDWTGLDCVNFKCQPLIIIWTRDFLPEQGPGLVTL